MVSKENKLHILLVDDDATDRELFIDAIQVAGLSIDVSEAADGEKALHFLDAATKLPDVIILDLNMPVKDGRETLADIKRNEAFKSIPVCIMTTSSAHFDILSAYQSGANLFLTKPFDFKGLVEMIGSLLTLFSKHVTLANSVANRA